MKTQKHIAMAGILAVFSLVFIACDNDNDTPKTYTVTFNADNGSQTTTQTVTEGGKAAAPATPTKANDVAGLYLGTPPDFCTFDDWYNGNVAWDFDTPVTSNITLKAQWIVPVPIDLTEIEGDTILHQTFAYIKDNETTESHTLLLDTDLVFSAGAFFGSGFSYDLAIIGLGEERTINSTSLRLRLYVGHDGANQTPSLASNLTLGKNISINLGTVTLSLLDLNQGNLTMQEGSKITGRLECYGGYDNPFSFTMNGGIINGIVNFQAIRTDIDQTFTISGNAEINELVLDSSYKNSGITIASEWTGSIGKLTISDYNRSYGGGLEQYLERWDNAVIVKTTSGYTLTEMDIARIITLGDFTYYDNTATTDDKNKTQPIGDTHKLELDTVNNVIKLVRLE